MMVMSIEVGSKVFNKIIIMSTPMLHWVVSVICSQNKYT